MANLDTVLKRLSSINITLPYRAILPFPDGSIGQGDRQATAFEYSGILAEAPSVTVTTSQYYIPHLRPRRR